MDHKGEQEARILTGEKSIGDRNSRMIADRLAPGAIHFIQKQVFFIVSSLDEKSGVCTSVITGKDGFIKVTDEKTIVIDQQLVNSNPYDLFWGNLMISPNVGLLFIEPSSRRRFRVNGKIMQDEDQLIIEVDQAYANCPKYIQQRHLSRTETPIYTDNAEQGTVLMQFVKEIISSADTFFVGSADNAGNLDASHRGGPPGFVIINEDDSLLIPDYSGNSIYNTLGNFLVNPVAGLLFLDFANYRTLQLQGRVEVIWSKEDTAFFSGGTGRFWKFYPGSWTLLDNLKGYSWNFLEYSPFNPA
jgi:predicted pyridoxine 5'-phosphate oxidase superfamily flavin-nucleotide-binding protein